MGIIEKIKNIADAIREKSGKTSLLTLDEMPAEIKNLSIGSGSVVELVPGAAPAYVNATAYNVATNVRALLNGEFKHDKCLVGICMSDSHYFPDSETKAGVWSGVNAIKALTYLLPVDFIAHLGDVAHEEANTQLTNDLQKERMNTVLGYLKECGGGKIPIFVAVGNHDTSVYITEKTDDYDVMSADYLYNNFTMLANIDEDTVVSGAECGGYCYRDFEAQKLRVYLLNTGDNTIRHGDATQDCTSEIQRAWIASTLIEGLNSKADANEWGFIILSHYPCDYGGNMPLSNLFEAYVNGKSIRLNNKDYNFAGFNSAKFVVQFHGHIHNFLVDQLSCGSPPTPYNAYRMAIPNAQSKRENYYGVVGGINFKEDKTYEKTANTAEDTSFVVNIINLTKNKIYSYCYGAGYDRTIDITGKTYYTITRNLIGATSSGTMSSVEAGSSFNETVTLAEGMELKNISVRMGLNDVGDAVRFENGSYIITIPEVTGNIVLEVTTDLRPNFTNLVRWADPYGGQSFSNNDVPGYYTDKRLNSSYSLAEGKGMITTGYIPISVDSGVTQKTIRIAGDGIAFKSGPWFVDKNTGEDADSKHCRLAIFDEDFNPLATSPYTYASITTSKNAILEMSGESLDDKENTILSITVDATHFKDCFYASYIMLSVFGTEGSNLVVTLNEEITYGGPEPEPPDAYNISYNMPTGVTSSNNEKTIPRDGAFSTQISVEALYQLSSVVVKMGGINITSQVYNSATNTITISEVTGNVSISVTTILSPDAKPAFTNLVTSAIDSDGTPYNNGLGYKNGYYIRSAGVETSTTSEFTLTGFITMPADGQRHTLRVAGDNIKYSVYGCMMLPYDENFVQLRNSKDEPVSYNNNAIASASVNIGDWLTEPNTTFTVTYANEAGEYGAPLSQAKYIRISTQGKGENLIVTLDEPIAYTI